VAVDDSERTVDAGDGEMLIGELAERTGLTQRTLRYYEEIGLLSPAARREGGFRVYSEADVQRVEHILQLKRLLGFSLLQIKEIVEAEEERKSFRRAYHHEPDPPTQREHVSRALEIARRELDRLDSHLADVQGFRAKVERRIARYSAELASLDADPAPGDESNGEVRS
jgi:MerR family transcriptional regulator, repressor of the yfmOP operon